MNVPLSTKGREILAAIFGRLYEPEFATLDGIAISCRTAGGFDYADGTTGLSLWLDDEISQLPADPEDRSAHALHAALYAAMPGHEAVISGWSRHLRALLLEGSGPPPPTSMMRNRGIADLAAHLVDPSALESSSLADTIDRAAALTEQNGMRHLLIVTSDGMVVVSGAPPFEAMAHWHNIEFAARVECLRLEEASAAQGSLA
jgi:ribulose-5-phosphate 4-epimerase/fuculose-1-phosphate aldolase